MIVAQADFGQSLQEAVSSVATFVPKFVAFLAILIIGYFVAKAIAKVLDRVLERVGFDRWVERGGIKKALERSRFDASDILSKIVFYALFLFVLQLAFGVWGPNPISELLYGVIAFLPRLFVAILIIVVASALAAAIREIIDASLGGLSYGRVLANVASAAIIAIGVFAALNQLRIAPAIVNGLFYAVLAVVAGSAIIAIGGGGIVPMRSRWERALSRVEEEAPQVRAQSAGAGQDVRARAAQRRAQAQPGPADGDPSSRDVGRGATATTSRTVRLPEDEPASAYGDPREPHLPPPPSEPPR